MRPARSLAFSSAFPVQRMQRVHLSFSSLACRPMRGRLAKRWPQAMQSPGVSLDSSDFERGDANPVDAVLSLDLLVPRAKIAELTRKTSDSAGLLQLAWHALCFAACAGVHVAAGSWYPCVSLCLAINLALYSVLHLAPWHLTFLFERIIQGTYSVTWSLRTRVDICTNTHTQRERETIPYIDAYIHLMPANIHPPPPPHPDTDTPARRHTRRRQRRPAPSAPPLGRFGRHGLRRLLQLHGAA